MKKVIFSAALILAVVGLVSCKNESKQTSTPQETIVKKAEITESVFGVRGNCGMCKNTIDKAAVSLEGVTSADWDRLRKEIKVVFDASKINLDAIHNAIAASGYDTDKVNGNLEAYRNLPGCCQYDHNMAMRLKADEVSPESESHSHH